MKAELTVATVGFLIVIGGVFLVQAEVMLPGVILCCAGLGIVLGAMPQ